MNKILTFVILCFTFAAPAAFGAEAAAPDALVKSTVDDVLTVIRENKDRRMLRELAEQKVLPHFDFKQMTQLAVGRAWRDANATQQQALENSFRSLLVNTYTNALAQAISSKQTIEVKPAQQAGGPNDVTVKTIVKEPGKQPISIDYRLANNGGAWKVYDVVVENLSLVTNYRGTFAAEIGRGGVDGLIKALEDKNRQLAKG